LPYRPRVAASLHDDGVELSLRNTGTRSTHLTVYGYAGEVTEPRHVDVKSAETVRLPAPNGRVDLIVTGPNRFQYELKGTTAGAAAGVDVSVDRRTGDSLHLELRNNGTAAVTLRLTSLQYRDRTTTVRLKPGARKPLGWETKNGWYDIEITAEQDPTFRRRLTGCEENGRAGISG
ncbi:MAG: DUF756 domain-containing protein, partial [Arthrobacter sp.]|nr:DUF756 domain-containing protein [Arthrobacter sp.]